MKFVVSAVVVVVLMLVSVNVSRHASPSTAVALTGVPGQPPRALSAVDPSDPGELSGPVAALPKGVSTSWYAHAQRELAIREYRISDTGEGLQAPNRSQGFRALFRPDGAHLVERENGANALLSLRFAGMVRAASTSSLSASPQTASVVRAGSARAELVHANNVIEWFHNSAAGLEHGFVLPEKPAGDAPLNLLVKVSGARVESEHGKLRFLSESGRRFDYQSLKVWDANQQAISARFAIVATNVLAIVIDDQHAQFPVTVDPLLSAAADRLLASEQAGAQFGYSVAGAGDINGDGYADVVIGAPYYDNGQAFAGAAFVYLGSASGLGSTATTTLESDQGDAQFGYSVAGAGDVNGDGYADVLIGARTYGNGEVNEGAAFVYLGSASGLDSAAATMLESNQDSAYFGWSVAGAGDINGDGYADVIVGAPNYDNGQVNEGAAFVYLGSANGLNSSATTVLESDQDWAQNGISVAGVGDINGDGYADVVVGMSGYDNGQNEEGAAIVYLGSASGLNLSTATTLESNQGGAEFGISVAGAGDVNGDGYADVVIGARFYDNGHGNTGAAFVYLGNAAGRAIALQQLSDDSNDRVVADGLVSSSTTSYRLRLTANAPRGRERVKAEIESCPLGGSFGSVICTTHISSAWQNSGSDGRRVIVETVTVPTPSQLYQWRARVLYQPLTAASNTWVSDRSPWRRLSAQADNRDIRVDADEDGDGILTGRDNCPLAMNADQVDNDGDDQGDVCDSDDDNDGVPDGSDAFPLDPTESVDTDGDGIGNNADTDDDNDGIPDVSDAFPLDPTESVDTDGDGIGNNADTDDDNDGVPDVSDVFPLDPTRSALPHSRGGGGSTSVIFLVMILVIMRFRKVR